MANYIMIELHPEDRERIDRLIEAVERITPKCDACATSVAKFVAEEMNTPKETHAERPVEPAEATEVEAPATPQPEEETPATAEPAVTLEQIQQKVVQLAAGQGGAKKAKVREIISAYGSKVSDLKDQPDKWTEVWDKLTALEGES